MCFWRFFKTGVYNIYLWFQICRARRSLQHLIVVRELYSKRHSYTANQVLAFSMPHSTAQIPPFPDDVPVAYTPRVSLAKLMGGDSTESDHFFDTMKSPGVMMLDLRDCPLGEKLLKDVDNMYKLSVDLFDLPVEEKDKYEIDWKTINGQDDPGNLVSLDDANQTSADIDA